MLYFDTTYLYRIYSQERGHEAVKHLLGQADRVATAWHGRAEFASILLRKRREGGDSPDLLAVLEAQFQNDIKVGLVNVLPLTEPVMLRLERTLRVAPSTTLLRAADALHLACAAEHGFAEVHSNDRHFLSAAPLFGLRGVDVIPKI